MDGTAPGHPEGPYVLNLAREPWDEHLDRASTWLANVVTTQAAFRQALEIADKGYVLVQGANAFTGTGKELLADPQVRKSFLGG